MDGYEIVKADKKEVYRDAFFSMKLVEHTRSPMLHGYVIEVENLAESVQEIDFAGMAVISVDDEYLQPRPKKATTCGEIRTRLYVVAVPTTSLH